MKTYITAFVLLILSYTSFAQTTPAPAETVLKEAYAKAASGNKNVILIFHASWCGWCRKMEASINDPTCKKLFDDNYVVAYLVVSESVGKEKLENPGSFDVLKKYNGDKSGLPFWLIQDAKGNTIAGCQVRPAGASMNTPAENMGCPTSETEVAQFTKILKSTSKLSDTDLAVIAARFRKNEIVKTTTGTN